MALIDEKGQQGPWSWMGSYVRLNGQSEQTVDFKDLTRTSDPRQLLKISFATLKDETASPSTKRAALDLIANRDRISDVAINQPSLFVELSDTEKDETFKACKIGVPVNVTVLRPLVEKYIKSENYYVGASAVVALTRLAKFDDTAKGLLDSLENEKSTKFIELGKLSQAEALTRLYNFAIKSDRNESKLVMDPEQAESHLRVLQEHSAMTNQGEVKISRLRGVLLEISFQNGKVDVGGFDRHYGYNSAELALSGNRNRSSWLGFAKIR